MLTREEQLGTAKPGTRYCVPVALETIEVTIERLKSGGWVATSAEDPGLLVFGKTPAEAEAGVPAAARALREARASAVLPDDDGEPRFTVEPVKYKGYGIGEFAIRFRPASRKNDDGTTSFGLSFHALIAGDLLADQETVLGQVAAVLNASDIGRPK